MKKGKLLFAAALVTTMSCQSAPARADVNIHISLDAPRAALFHPLYDNDYFYNTGYSPNLLFVPQLGFYVSVGLPYDLLFFDNFYYVYHSNNWYHSRNYGGPWVVVTHNRLPRTIRNHHWRDIRHYSDREYRRNAKHRWLKHRHNAYKHEKKSIRNSPFYHETRSVQKKVYRKKPDRRIQKAYKIRNDNDRRRVYKIRNDNDRRGVYKGINNNDRRRAEKVKPDKNSKRVYREKNTKTWKNRSGERVIVKETTRKSTVWRNKNNDRKEKRWAENRINRKDNRNHNKENRSREKRWGRDGGR